MDFWNIVWIFERLEWIFANIVWISELNGFSRMDFWEWISEAERISENGFLDFWEWISGARRISENGFEANRSTLQN